MCPTDHHSHNNNKNIISSPSVYCYLDCALRMHLLLGLWLFGGFGAVESNGHVGVNWEAPDWSLARSLRRALLGKLRALGECY
jgi:hypothetical protein